MQGLPRPPGPPEAQGVWGCQHACERRGTEGGVLYGQTLANHVYVRAKQHCYSRYSLCEFIPIYGLLCLRCKEASPMASGRYTAVQSIVSPVTMRANGHKAPLL